MYDLKKAKERIRIESAVAKDNEELKRQLMEDDDCFGRGYSVDNSHCKECTVNSSFDTYNERGYQYGPHVCKSLWEWCREVTREVLADRGEKDEITLLKEKLQDKIKEYKEEK